MAVNFSNGFNITVKEPVDLRIIKTKNQMLNMSFSDKSKMPDIYFCLCPEDKKFYIYDKDAEEDVLTGKFRPIEQFLTFDTPAAKEKFEDAIKNSTEIASIKEILGDNIERTGVFAEIDEVTNTVNTIETKIEAIDSDIEDLKPEVEKAKEDINDIKDWLDGVTVEGGEIKASYLLDLHLTGVKLDSEDKSIEYMEEKVFEFDPLEGYQLPNSIKINNVPVGSIDTDCDTTTASWLISEYDSDHKPYGKLTLKNTINNVTCEIIAEAI